MNALQYTYTVACNYLLKGFICVQKCDNIYEDG